MTPKRLRLIALIIRRGIQAHSDSTEALAQELEEHATELEDLERGTRREVRIKEPDTVFNDLTKTFPKASEGMR